MGIFLLCNHDIARDLQLPFFVLQFFVFAFHLKNNGNVTLLYRQIPAVRFILFTLSAKPQLLKRCKLADALGYICF